MEVTVVGDVNPDLLYIVDSFPALDSQSIARAFQMKLGGSAANTAYALAKLGAKTWFYGCVGRDDFGAFCERELKKAGVKAVLCKTDVNTGITSAVEFKGTRTMFTHRGANEFLDINHINLHGDWLHLSGYWHLTNLRQNIEKLFKDAKKRDMHTSFDVGSWSRDWRDSEYIIRAVEKGYVDFLLADAEEISGLTGLPIDDAIERLRKKTVIGLHQGRNGATMYWEAGEYHVPAWEIRPIRTTGAGDTWNAGFIWAYMQLGDVKRAAEIAMDIVENYVLGKEVKAPVIH